MTDDASSLDDLRVGPFDDADDVLTPAEVAAVLDVDRKTVTRWANKGKLPSFRTAGGHRRFYRREVERIAALDRPRAVH